MKHHRIARGEFPVEVDLVLREPTLGTEERSWLGFGTMTSYLDIRKSAQGEKTWWVFDVEDKFDSALLPQGLTRLRNIGHPIVVNKT